MIKYIFKQKKLLLINIFFTLLYSVLNIYLAFILSDIVNLAISKNFSKYYWIILKTFIYLTCYCVVIYFLSVVRAKLLKKSTYNMKKDVFGQIISKNIINFNDENSANYISILNNDLKMIEEDLFTNALLSLSDIFSFIISTVIMFKISVYIALGVFSISILTATIPQLLMPMVRKRKKNFSDSLSSFMVQVNDLFKGFEIIKGFNIERAIKNQYDRYNKNLVNNKYELDKSIGLTNAITDFLGYSMMFCSIIIGTYLVITGYLNVGIMIASVQLINNIANPITNLTTKINTYKSAKLIDNKIKKLFDSEEIINSYEVSKNEFNSYIKFENVSFSYSPDKKVLDNVSFVINKKDKIALIGKSGSGKSTIVKLFMRYFNNFEGQIMIDGVDIKQIKFDSIYNLMSIIQQNVFLFDTSIKNNILLYGDYSNQDLQRAITNARLDSLVNSLPNKEESLVGENGCNFSGGEKQRISIARTFIKNTPILILDEATSALDKSTALNIEDLLLEMSELTTIVITHNISKENLSKFQKILLIEDGKILFYGPYADLSKNNDFVAMSF